MAALGVSTAAGLLAKVKAGIQSSALDDDSKNFLISEIDGEGLDLNHSETRTMVQSFVDSEVMTTAESEQLLSVIDETVPVWQGLKNGHVQNALRAREAGEI